MGFDLRSIVFNLFRPAAPSGYVNLPIQTVQDGPNQCVSVAAPILVGDTGSGGSAGLAPAPAAGDAAAGKYLKADGTYAVPAGVIPSGAANEVYATPDGASGSASLRALVANDIPSLPESKIINLATDLAAKAPLASPALTGTPTAPTPASGDNSTQIATTAWVKEQNYSSGAKGTYTGNSAQGSSTGTSTTAVFSSAVTAGSAIVAVVRGPTSTTFSDNQGNTYSLLSGPQGFFNASLYVALNVAAGATTISVSGSTGSGVSVVAFEVKNVVSVSAVDGTVAYASGSGGGSPMTITASTTTSNASDYLLAVGMIGGGSGYTVGWSSPFTGEVGFAPDANAANWFMADANVSAAGAQSVGFTFTDFAQTYVYLIALKSTGTIGSGGVTSVNTRTGAVTLGGTDIPVFGASGSSHAQGAVPDPGSTAGTTKYLREDGSWQVPPTSTGSNATQIQGVNVSASAPTNGQVQAYNSATSEYEPTTISGTGGGAFPFTVVQQDYYNSGTSGVASFTITFPKAAAASGNTLFVIIGGAADATIGLPSGWSALINQTQASYSRLIVATKTSAGDTSATFTRTAGSAVVPFSIYFCEFSGSRSLDQSSLGGSANATYLSMPAITPAAGSAVFAVAAGTNTGSPLFPLVMPPLLSSSWLPIGAFTNVNGGRFFGGYVYNGSGGGASITPPTLSFQNIGLYASGGLAYATFSLK